MDEGEASMKNTHLRGLLLVIITAACSLWFFIAAAQADTTYRFLITGGGVGVLTPYPAHPFATHLIHGSFAVTFADNTVSFSWDDTSPAVDYIYDKGHSLFPSGPGTFDGTNFSGAEHVTIRLFGQDQGLTNEYEGTFDGTTIHVKGSYSPDRPLVGGSIYWYDVTAVVSEAPILTVAKSGSGSGTVTSDPAGIDCGTACTIEYTGSPTITLTATADDNSVFVGWAGACTGPDSCAVVVDGDQTVTALFNKKDFATISLGTKNFGNVAVGKTRTLVQKIGNSGVTPLQIGGVTVTGANYGEFSVLHDWCSGQTIAAKGSCRIAVSFSPMSPGSKTGQMVIVPSSDASTMVSALIGTTEPDVAVCHAKKDFGKAPMGTTRYQTFRVLNKGTVALTLTSSVAVTGAGFSKVADNCSATIDPKSSCRVVVAFNPSSEGLQTGQLEVLSNDPDTPALDVPLAGTGKVVTAVFKKR